MKDIGDRPELLNSWKQIAAHLGVSVRTAQRWSEAENLPARRHRDGARGSVFVYKSELDSWLAGRPHLREGAPDNATQASSVAVLPFADLNRDEGNEIFADGLTEELINALAQVEGLRVVARTSSFQFKGKTGDTRTIAARLGVRTLLEGSVRRSDDRLLITVQLINAADGCHLWSQRFDRRMQGVFELQEEIAQGIVDALRVKLGGDRITRRYTGDPETYAVYLEGRHYWNRRTRPGILNAIERFKRVVASDARMAPAWAGLADCYATLPAFGAMPAGEALPLVRATALKALAIDETLAEAHTALGFAAALHEFDWAGAECRFRRALDLKPNYADAHLLYAALVLAPTGRLEEGETHQRRACELDPLSAVMMSALGTCYLMLRKSDEAIAECRQALELDPAYPWAHRWLGEAYLLKGLYHEAEKAFSMIAAPAFGAGFLAYCYAHTDRVSLARQLLQGLMEMSNPQLAYQIAVGHLGLDELDTAFNWLSKACDAHALGIHWLRTDPIWDVLRTDRRFTELLKRMGLTE